MPTSHLFVLSKYVILTGKTWPSLRAMVSSLLLGYTDQDLRMNNLHKDLLSGKMHIFHFTDKISPWISELFCTFIFNEATFHSFSKLHSF